MMPRRLSLHRYFCDFLAKIEASCRSSNGWFKGELHPISRGKNTYRHVVILTIKQTLVAKANLVYLPCCNVTINDSAGIDF